MLNKIYEDNILTPYKPDDIDNKQWAFAKSLEKVIAGLINNHPESLSLNGKDAPLVDFLNEDGVYELIFDYAVDRSSDHLTRAYGYYNLATDPVLGMCEISLVRLSGEMYEDDNILSEIKNGVTGRLRMTAFLHEVAFKRAGLEGLLKYFNEELNTEERLSFAVEAKSGYLRFDKNALRLYIQRSLCLDITEVKPITFCIDIEAQHMSILEGVIASKNNAWGRDAIQREVKATMLWLEWLATLWERDTLKLGDILDRSLPRCAAIFDFFEEFLMLPNELFVFEDEAIKTDSQAIENMIVSYSKAVDFYDIDADWDAIVSSGRLWIDEEEHYSLVEQAHLDEDGQWGDDTTLKALGGSFLKPLIIYREMNDAIAELEMSGSFFGLYLIEESGASKHTDTQEIEND